LKTDATLDNAAGMDQVREEFKQMPAFLAAGRIAWVSCYSKLTASITGQAWSETKRRKDWERAAKKTLVEEGLKLVCR
jgi:hypothetical protein